MDRAEMDKALGTVWESYKRAIERALWRVPVRNGAVSSIDLWLETALPVDLIAELLREDQIEMPDHVERIDLDRGARRGKTHGRGK